MHESFEGTEPLTTRNLVTDTLAADPKPTKYSFTLLKMDGAVFAQTDQEVDTGVILLTKGDGVIQRTSSRLDTWNRSHCAQS